MGYFHVVFTLPTAIGDIAYQNKRVIYNLLFKASVETMQTIAADPKHLGAKIGITSVLHTLLLTAPPTGARRRVENAQCKMTHHPHVHMIVRPCGAGLRCVRDVVLSGWCKSDPWEVTAHVADGNCVAARRGGEQPEANE